MNKQSYKSKNEKKIKPVRNLPVINNDTSKEDGSRGYIMPGMYSGQPFMKNEEGEGSITSILEKYKNNKNKYNDLKDFMIDLSDSLDKNGDQESILLANFGDFLIKKIAELDNIDYSKDLNNIIEYINKNNSLNKEDEIKKIVLEFNNFVKLNGKDIGINNAKFKALNLVKKHVNNIEESIEKKAQILESDPVYIANQLTSIIRIMLSRISNKSRPKSFLNIKNKLKYFNTMEISRKKNPGGAAIGVSLGLVKNVLNGKDPYFINVVIQELIKRL
jgi:hypothetical protein